MEEKCSVDPGKPQTAEGPILWAALWTREAEVVGEPGSPTLVLETQVHDTLVFGQVSSSTRAPLSSPTK